MSMLDESILIKFVDKFYGYGNFNSQIWFIGMEPGAPEEIEWIKKFFDVWKNRGEPSIDNVKESHLETGIRHYTKWFEGNCPIEKTWGGLIKILLTIEGNDNIAKNEIQSYQNEKLGNEKSNHCLIELLPLPSPPSKNNKWPYEDIEVKEIADRKSYTEKYIYSRSTQIKELINAYNPEIIIFYSLTYKKFWEKIAGQEFSLCYGTFQKKVWCVEEKNTLYLIIAHPASWGKFGNYFVDVGKFIRKHLAR